MGVNGERGGDGGIAGDGDAGVKGLKGHSARYLAEKARRTAAAAAAGEKRDADAMDVDGDINPEDSIAPAPKRLHHNSSSSSDPQHLPSLENTEDENLVLQTLSSLFAESANNQLSNQEIRLLGEWQRRSAERDGRVASRRDASLSVGGREVGGGWVGNGGGWVGGIAGGGIGGGGIGGGGVGGREGFRDDVDNRVGS